MGGYNGVRGICPGAAKSKLQVLVGKLIRGTKDNNKS